MTTTMMKWNIARYVDQDRWHTVNRREYMYLPMDVSSFFAAEILVFLVDIPT